MEEARREAILFRDSLLAALSEGGPQFSEDRGAFLKRVVAFGPRGVGSNVLARHSRMSVSVNGETPSSSTDESAAMPTDFDGDLWRQVEGAIAAGFQLASAAGPLAEEPMHGICFLVESVKIQQGEGVVVTRDEEPELPTPLTTTGEEPTPAPPEPPAPTAAQTTIASGPLIASVKVACRAAFLTANVRVVEAYYRCELQCAQKHLGSLYGLLAKRRGRVVDEDVIEGTDLFLISALLPVVESFGFGAEMLEWTSGAATAPQLSFAHWELMDFDPFWQPLTADEREDISYGEASLTRTENVARRCIRRIRERKGRPSSAVSSRMRRSNGLSRNDGACLARPTGVPSDLARSGALFAGVGGAPVFPSLEPRQALRVSFVSRRASSQRVRALEMKLRGLRGSSQESRSCLAGGTGVVEDGPACAVTAAP